LLSVFAKNSLGWHKTSISRGLKPRLLGVRVDVWAEARTYLRGKGKSKGNSKGNSKGKGHKQWQEQGQRQGKNAKDAKEKPQRTQRGDERSE
jgi:hypothetical protein